MNGRLLEECVEAMLDEDQPLTEDGGFSILEESQGVQMSTRQIKHFHPNGKTMPNGSHIQRGGFSLECRNNATKFILDEKVHPVQYGLKEYRGGIIVFSTEVNALEFSKSRIKNKIMKVLATFGQRLRRKSIIRKVIDRMNRTQEEQIGAYSIGNLFSGRYIDDNGQHYDESSLALEINGLSSKSLLRLGEELARAFHQQTVLIKDLNPTPNKFYLADGVPNHYTDEEFRSLMDGMNTDA